MTQTMKIIGLTCEACTKLTTKRLLKIDGVRDVSVDLATGLATFSADKNIPVENVNEVFAGTNYRAEE